MKNIFKFCRNKQNIDIDKYSEVLGATLIHELRAPLITIKSGASIVKDDLGKLIRSYRLAREKNVIIPEIQTKHLDQMLDFLNNVEEQALVANFFVNLIGFILRNESNQQNIEVLEIKSVLSDAISRLPKHLKEKNYSFEIIDQSENFEVKANRESLEIVFCALIYDAIQRSLPKKQLVISITSKKNIANYQVQFQDNAQQNIHVDNLFDRYYMINGELQLGLYYCKNVMKKIGGDITCTLTEDQKTIYLLNFPNI